MATSTRRAKAAPPAAPAQPAARPGKAATPAGVAPQARKAIQPVATPKVAKAKKPGVEAKSARAEKEKEKEKKPKLVRDSFTIPKAEYAVLDALKQRAATLGQPAKKSELLRAGVMALAAMADRAFAAQLAAVPAVKTGRPPKA